MHVYFVIIVVYHFRQKVHLDCLLIGQLNQSEPAFFTTFSCYRGPPNLKAGSSNFFHQVLHYLSASTKFLGSSVKEFEVLRLVDRLYW